jgi:hypothetical protein
MLVIGVSDDLRKVFVDEARKVMAEHKGQPFGVDLNALTTIRVIRKYFPGFASKSNKGIIEDAMWAFLPPVLKIGGNAAATNNTLSGRTAKVVKTLAQDLTNL